MTIVNEEQIESFEDAAQLAFGQVLVSGMKAEVAVLFTVMLDHERSDQEIVNITASAIKREYGKDAKGGLEKFWLVPVPLPRYEGIEAPSLIIETTVYLVVRAWVRPEGFSKHWHISIVQPWGKPLRTVLPIFFLLALLDKEEGRFCKVGKDGPWSSWQIEGLKQPLRLHDGFLEKLRQLFKLKPVADWLDDFGTRGQSIAPLVVGALLGLMYRGSSSLLPEEQGASRQELLQKLTGFGYGLDRVQRAMEKAEPELRGNMTTDEAVETALKYIEKEI